MLGTYTRGMTIKIPANFKSNGNPVPVENVTVRIEHWDEMEQKVIHDLNSTSMKQISPSDYIYEYEVPQALKEGSYVISITAKIPQNGGKLFEAFEEFHIAHSKIQPIANPEERSVGVEEIERTPPRINNSNDFYAQANLALKEKIIQDIVVDVENKPIKGVHVNVYPKREFTPGDPGNVKVGSTITDDEGRWSLLLPAGDYAFSYKGIGFKEYREFRKV